MMTAIDNYVNAYCSHFLDLRSERKSEKNTESYFQTIDIRYNLQYIYSNSKRLETTEE